MCACCVDCCQFATPACPLPQAEKLGLFANGAGSVSRLNIPAYQWWSEALHGVAYSPGVNFNQLCVCVCGCVSDMVCLCTGVSFGGAVTAATSFPQVRCLSVLSPTLSHVPPFLLCSPPHSGRCAWLRVCFCAQVITTAASFNASLFNAVGTAIGIEGRAMSNLGQAGNVSVMPLSCVVPLPCPFVHFWAVCRRSGPPTSTSSVTRAGAAARRRQARTPSSPQRNVSRVCVWV